MYLVGLLVFVFVLVCSILLGAPLIAFLDLPSVLMIVLITLPMLMASGLFPDFKRSFRVIMAKSNQFSEEEIRRSLLAVQLTTKLVVGAGLFGTLIAAISMARAIQDPSVIGPSLSVALLTIFYGFCFVFLLMPIQAKLKSLIIGYGIKSK